MKLSCPSGSDAGQRPDPALVQEETLADLRGFLEHVPAAAATKDAEGRYRILNARMEALLGRETGTVLGLTDRELLPAEVAECLAQADRQVMQEGRAREVEEKWPQAEGPPQQRSTLRFPLADGAGGCRGVGIISLDVTERKRVEQALLQSQKLESMGLLAGGIAHDFNNLLGAILGNVGLVEMDLPPSSPALQHLKNLEALVMKATYLTRQMLAYSGRGKVVVRSLNLNTLVEEITHLLRISISKKATIRFDTCPDLPSIEGDASQIQQVVMNLVINASDALGDRSGTISLRTGIEHLGSDQVSGLEMDQELAAGIYVFLEVSDDGVGMSAETRSRIFDPFFTTKFTGRGLGLAAVHGIVRSHGGSIRVYSELGRGTTFKILFPGTSLPTGAVAPAEAYPEYRGRGIILVVDDEASIRTVAEAVLTRSGFEILHAQDGQEALDCLAERGNEIRLVIMDLTMPRLDGEEAYREMRRRGYEVPVILSSGFSEMDAVNRFLGKGLAGFLHKPYRNSSLLRMVAEALDRKTP
jgi:PAS domain S-box-containing protein